MVESRKCMQIQAISLIDVSEKEKSKVPLVIILSVVQRTIIFEVDLTCGNSSVFQFSRQFLQVKVQFSYADVGCPEVRIWASDFR